MSDEKPLLNQLDLVTRDFEASLAFYRRLGVDLRDASGGEGIRHAETTLPNGFVLHLDNEHLAGLYNAAWRRPERSCRALIGFSVATREAVDALYADLVGAGYPGRQPPYDTFWGARYAVVADPDGNDVGLMSPSDDARRSWPPTPSPDRGSHAVLKSP
jgi:uncharacterized glyoxalase superfamily protein PhnB